MKLTGPEAADLSMVAFDPAVAPPSYGDRVTPATALAAVPDIADPEPVEDIYAELADLVEDAGGCDVGFQYPGAKAAMAETICALLGLDRASNERPGGYIEVFGGSAAVMLHARPCMVEVYNDLNNLVYLFFKVCREQPRELFRAMYWTPYSQTEFDRSDYTEPGLTELETVRRWLVRTNQTMPGAASDHRGKFVKTVKNAGQSNATKWFRYKKRIKVIGQRFQKVQLTNEPALDLIAQIVKNNDPDVAMYLDPPYITATRDLDYAVDMPDTDHAAMIAIVIDYRGPCVVSGYEHPLYHRLDDADGWHRVEVDSRNARQAKRTEVLWTNRAPSGQQGLF